MSFLTVPARPATGAALRRLARPAAASAPAHADCRSIF